jgi:hypothetical protein
MSKRRVFAGTLVILLTTCLGAVSAGAAPSYIKAGGAKAVVVGYVHIDPSNPAIASLTAKYTCPTGEGHLFVSAKQVADGHPDPALKLDGSSSISAGWLERHPGPDEFTCDGTWHTGTFEFDSFTEYGFGTLRKGQVYVQFCLSAPGEDESPAWFAFYEQFVNAR